MRKRKREMYAHTHIEGERERERDGLASDVFISWKEISFLANQQRGKKVLLRRNLNYIFSAVDIYHKTFYSCNLTVR